MCGGKLTLHFLINTPSPLSNTMVAASCSGGGSLQQGKGRWYTLSNNVYYCIMLPITLSTCILKLTILRDFSISTAASCVFPLVEQVQLDVPSLLQGCPQYQTTKGNHSFQQFNNSQYFLYFCCRFSFLYSLA